MLLAEEEEEEGAVVPVLVLVVEPTAAELSLKLGFSWGISNLLTHSKQDEYLIETEKLLLKIEGSSGIFFVC